MQLLGTLIFAAILVHISALVPTILAEMFPTETRNSGCILGYNIALALFGETTPLVFLKLIQLTENHLAPAFYLIACALVSFIALFLFKNPIIRL